MSNQEGNSAELEAERILEDAARKIQTEECPQGDECAVHHRVPDEYEDEKIKYARYITYCGDYAVITEDNQELMSSTFLIKAVLGLVNSRNIPPRWETTIFFVGSGTIGDLADLKPDAQHSALRYRVTHDSWEGVKDVHVLTVASLREGMIDVSRSMED